jgi:thioredoxin reductase (NADPH)
MGGCGVELDKAGFVITGAHCSQSRERQILPLESNIRGVFAVGDVRSGSVKRIGGAIGEGAQVVQSLHSFLADAAAPTLAAADFSVRRSGDLDVLPEPDPMIDMAH